MDLYSFSLTLGGAGLLFMGVLGLSHTHGSRGGDSRHSGHAHHHDTHSVLATLLSPRVIFSFLLGMGTVGLVMRPITPEPLLGVAAIAGGLVFERFIVNRLWNFMFRFASAPALTLESAIEDEARAVTNFDTSGCGLISVEVDGHLVQVLGMLSKTDRESGVRIRAGDSVRIEEVDADRNRCTVRRM